MRKELLGNSAEEAISGDDKGGEGAAAGLSIHLVAPVPVQYSENCTYIIPAQLRAPNLQSN